MHYKIVDENGNCSSIIKNKEDVHKYLAYGNMIEVKDKKYSIFDHDTMLEFELYKNSEDYIMQMCKYGEEALLEWYFNSHYESKCNEKAIECATVNGHLNILKMFKYLTDTIPYSDNIAILAAEYGHIDILEWLKQSNHKFTNVPMAMDKALKKRNFNVVKWLAENIERLM